MKTTIWTLATSDDGQMDIMHFGSEADLNAEILGQIQKALGAEFDDLLEAAGGDVQEAYSIAQEYHDFSIDMHWTSHTLDLRPPAGVNAELLAAAKAVFELAEFASQDEGGFTGDNRTEYERLVRPRLQAAIAAAEAGQVEG